MNFTNPYTILEIDKYSTTDDIRKAYKSLMMKHHPDTGDGNRAKFDEVRLAYIQLKDKLSEPFYFLQLSVTFFQLEIMECS